MKIRELAEDTGSWGLVAEPGDYDAVPALDRLLFDRQPRSLSPDRVALAAYLVFGAHASGEMQMPRRVSPALAEAISADARPVWLQVSPVEFYAKPLAIGRRTMRLFVEGLHRGTPLADDSEPRLHIMRSDRSRGARMTFTSLEVSSNAWLFGIRATPETRLRVAVACALLFAEDLEMDECMVPRTEDSQRHVQRLLKLTSAVRVHVSTA